MENNQRIAAEVLGDSYFPVKEVAEEAIKEKKGRSPIFEMHFWWGRKPLIASRAAILMSSLPKSSENKILEYLGLNIPIKQRKKRAFNHSVDIEELSKHYKKIYGKSRPLLLDPFAGGGSIPYEALRLGFDVIACEYNPVAWSILQAIIVYPKKYGNQIVDRIESVFIELVSELKTKLERYYPKNNDYITSTYMYAWEIKCPYCNLSIPLVNNWILKKKPSKNAKNNLFDWIYMFPKFQKNQFEIEIKEENAVSYPKNLHEGTVIRGKVRCPFCNNIISNKHVVKEINEKKSEIPLIMVQIQEKKNGKTYIPFNKENLDIWDERKELIKLMTEDILPEFSMPLKIVPTARYLDTWDQLTNERQRYFFYNLILTARKIAHKKSKEWGVDWGKVVAIYFALLIGKSIDFNTRCTSWASKEGIRNSLAFRRPSMVWDHCEINPFSPKGSGNLKTVINNIMSGLNQACKDLKDTPGDITILYGSMMEMEFPQVDLIVTDPPYADDVQYPELSEFFYAWEQAILLPFFSFFPQDSPPSAEDLSANKADRNQEFVEYGLSLAFTKLKNLLTSTGRLSLFFAHGSLDVWSFVINALIDSGFTILSTFPVHTESRDNVIALGKASFMTSTLISAIARQTDRSAFYEEIEEEIKSYSQLNIKSLIEYGFRGSDLSMAALGPVLKKISEYSEIKSITGKIKISNILSLTSDILVEQILGSSVLSSVDDITRGYLYTRLSGQKVLNHDAMQLMAKSLGIELEILRNSTIFEERRVGKQKSYYLKNFKERKIKGNSLIDQIHLGFQACEKGGKQAFWKEIEENKHLVKEVLKLINHGIERSKLAPEVDADTLLSKQISGLTL